MTVCFESASHFFPQLKRYRMPAGSICCAVSRWRRCGSGGSHYPKRCTPSSCSARRRCSRCARPGIGRRTHQQVFTPATPSERLPSGLERCLSVRCATQRRRSPRRGGCGRLRTNPRPEMAMPRRRWRGAGTNRPRRGVSGTVAFGRLGLRLCQTISERGSCEQERLGTCGRSCQRHPPQWPPRRTPHRLWRWRAMRRAARGRWASGSIAPARYATRELPICPAQAVMPAVNHHRKLKECCWRGRWAWLWTRSSWRCRGNPSLRRWRRRGASCRPPRGLHRAEPAEAGRGGWCDRDALSEQTIQ